MPTFQDTRRGDVWFAEDSIGPRDPQRSNVCWGNRPVIILSCDFFNARASVVTVIPMTTNTSHAGLDNNVLLPAGTATDRDSMAKVSQITTVDRNRLTAWMGHVSPEKMNEIEHALQRHLGFEPEEPRQCGNCIMKRIFIRDAAPVYPESEYPKTYAKREREDE